VEAGGNLLKKGVDSMKIQIAPSILSADFARLGDQVREVERAGANRIHVDVMDGHFVPNLSMGPAIVASLRPITRLPLEVHLMIEKPAQFVDSFIEAGADSLIVHWEVLPDPLPVLRDVRQKGKRIGLALNPETSVTAATPFLADLDLVLCMTVHPGFGGQEFLPQSPDRIKQLRNLLDAGHHACDLEVDGGIELDTARLAINAGANVLVAGTAIFRHGAPVDAVRSFRALEPA
jgi:ribulose-phosphate 3-epimerase